jgi:hypothetical protein
MYYESSYSQIQLNSATGSLIDFSTSGTDYLARILYTNATNLLEFKNNVGTTNFALANSGAATFSSTVWAQGAGSVTNPTIAVRNDDCGLYSPAINTLGFTVNSAERMRITSGGNVLIGTTTDSGYKLDVSGTGRFTGNLQFGTESILNGNNWYLLSGAANTELAINFSGKSGAALKFYSGVTPVFTVTSAGAATFSSSVTSTAFFESSSIAYKNILATNPTTSLNVDVIKYTRKNVDTDDVRYGYSAEQINSLMPELTNKDVTAVKYLDVHTLLIAELQREIKELKSKLK